MVARYKLDAAPEARVFLQEWRETRFPTQQALADRIGLAAATISRIETGEREWGKGYLEALAFAVGCKVGDLFSQPNADQDQQLRSALLSYGVDSRDMGAVFKAIKGFVDEATDAQSEQSRLHGQSEPANPRHEAMPSRSKSRLPSA